MKGWRCWGAGLVNHLWPHLRFALAGDASDWLWFGDLIALRGEYKCECDSCVPGGDETDGKDFGRVASITVFGPWPSG